jgi:signal transduction histidine kinase
LPILLACGPHVAADDPPAGVNAIRDLLVLPRAAREAGPPVAIRGLVTLRLLSQSWVCVQDDTAAIWVRWDAGDDLLETLPLGSSVLVHGVVRPGIFAPILIAKRVTVLGTPGLPPARPADLDRIFLGADIALRVVCEGVVQRVGTAPNFAQSDAVTLLLACGSRHLRVDVVGTLDELPTAAWLDARVRVTGVVNAIRNARGELREPHLIVAGPGDVEVVAGPEPSADEVRLDRLGDYRFDPDPGRRLTTEGVVTFATKQRVVLQAGGTGVRADVARGPLPEVGDRVRVSGFPDPARQVVGLRDAIVTRLGSGPTPEPVAISPRDVVRINEAALTENARSDPGDYDGTLVTFRGQLLEVQTPAGGVELLLACDGVSVTARLDAAAAPRLAALVPGSGLEVRGICQVRAVGDPGPLAARSLVPPVEVELLLRSPDDVTVVSTPSWWTPRRLAAVLAATAVALTAALAWAWLLRREVATQAGMLAREMRLRRDAAIEFEATLRERNRLAANLHDTLLQTLVGADYQLGACGLHGAQTAPGTTEHLGIARGMLAHATQELRQSVWALRSVPLDGRPFVEAVDGVVAQISQGHPETLSVRADGPPHPLPKFVAGNLLLVVQEAVHNALQHAAARRIDVAVRYDAAGERIAVEVRDDGRGFDVADRPGAADGHFGLAGMRERAERLGGELAIDSRPGGGTTVRVAVPLRPFDAELDDAGR